MWRCIGIAAIAAVASFHHRAAEAVDAACENCSAARMASMAMSLGRGDHRIFSLSTNTLRAYSVTCSGDAPAANPAGLQDNPETDPGEQLSAPGACPFGRPLQVDDSPVDSATRQAWTLIHDFYAKYGQADRVDVKFNTDLPEAGSFGNTVYPTLSDYQARTDLFELILSRSQGIKDYTAMLSAALLAHLNIIPNQLLIGVTFRDGSTIVLKYDAATRTLSIVPNTARLSNGAAVVERNSADYQGTYPIAGIDQTAYFNYLHQQGVPVVNATAGYKLECTWNGVKLSCRVLTMAN